MASGDFELAPLPPPGRGRNLWLQHAAGFILFEDVRNYARQKIAPGLDEPARAAALKAIDDALYGLMMVIDGVADPLSNAEHAVRLAVTVRVDETSGAEKPVLQFNLADGDGMCMGFHGWREGDFGENPVVLQIEDEAR